MAGRALPITVFAAVAAVHFVLSFAGQALALRVAFDSQPGGTPSRLDLAVVRVAEILLVPLTLAERLVPGLVTPSGHLETAATSALFGAGAVGVLWLWGRRRSPPEPPSRRA